MAVRWIGWACAMGLSSAFPLHTRQTTTSNSHSAKIIAPVVVVSVVCIMLVGFGWWKRRKQTRELLQQLQTPATNTTNNTTNNANSTTPSTGADAPARPPRRRRRRRPSQISTKSLPAYNEQAGDEEIVLVRRAQRESESDDEDDENDNDNGRRSTQPSTSHAPDSRPLLDEDSSPDMPRVSLASSSRGRSPNDHPDPQSPEQSQLGHESIANATTIASSIADTELEPEPSPAAPHPHEVPSYTEAMSTSHVNLPTTTETDHSAQPSTSTATEIDPPVPADADGTVRPKRKSVFRHLGRFHISKPSGSSTPAPEAVEMSTTSPRPSTSSNRPSGSTHRPSTSLSTNTHKPSPSLSSLSLILTRSQSPTMSRTSLNISAPISTTLVRTELNYPRAGPTPEQIRFLSSRESLGRFGMPYGEQAIAAAKSRDHLPPVYKPRVGDTPGPSGSGAGAGGSEAGNHTVQEDEPTVTIRRGPMFLTPGELAQRKTSETAASGPAEAERDRADSDPILDPAMTIQEEPIAVEEAIQEDSKSIQEDPMTAVNGDGQESRGQVESRRRVSPLEFNDARRESVMTTNSFVTATEGQGDSSPPTPTAETYQTQVPTLSHGLGTQDQSPNSAEQQSNGSEQQAHVPGGAQFQAPGGTTASTQSPVPTRAQTVLIPESRDALHPELTLVPATPIGEP